MHNDQWEELYVLAAKEADGKRMPERIAAAKNAASERLKDLEMSSNHEERARIASVLEQLDSIEADAGKW